LVDVLTGKVKLQDAIQKTELQEKLYLLTAGGRPKYPAEWVGSETFRDLVLALREKFDYVLIDSPPALPVSDPASIASIVDGVHMVTRIRKGVLLTAQRAKETLDRVGANWMGIIVNGVDENPFYNEYGSQYAGRIYKRYYETDNTSYQGGIVAK
jgi:succinoglycan biosynthesis transport protein ExoP